GLKPYGRNPPNHGLKPRGLRRVQTVSIPSAGSLGRTSPDLRGNETDPQAVGVTGLVADLRVVCECERMRCGGVARSSPPLLTDQSRRLNDPPGRGRTQSAAGGRCDPQGRRLAVPARSTLI